MICGASIAHSPKRMRGGGILAVKGVATNERHVRAVLCGLCSRSEWRLRGAVDARITFCDRQIDKCSNRLVRSTCRPLDRRRHIPYGGESNSTGTDPRPSPLLGTSTQSPHQGLPAFLRPNIVLACFYHQLISCGSGEYREVVSYKCSLGNIFWVCPVGKQKPRAHLSSAVREGAVRRAERRW